MILGHVRYLEILDAFPYFTYSRLSDFSAVRTSDWDKPNCRAMRAGVMPALKAARTAFSLINNEFLRAGRNFCDICDIWNR